jgi:hypothetical protein
MKYLAILLTLALLTSCGGGQLSAASSSSSSSSSSACGDCDNSKSVSDSLVIGSGGYADDLILAVPSFYTSGYSYPIIIDAVSFDGYPPLVGASLLIYILKPSGEEIPIGNGVNFNAVSYYPSEFDQLRIESNLPSNSVLVSVSYSEFCNNCGVYPSITQKHSTQTDSLWFSIDSVDGGTSPGYSSRPSARLFAVDGNGSNVSGTWTVVYRHRDTGNEITSLNTYYYNYPPWGCDMIAYFDNWSPGVILLGSITQDQ